MRKVPGAPTLRVARALQTRPDEHSSQHLNQPETATMKTPDPSARAPLSRLCRAGPAAWLLWACAAAAWAHGDVTPQAVDTRELPQLGEELSA